MVWTGNGVFRSGGVDFIPEGTSTAARLLAGAYGPHPNQNAPPGFGGLIAGPGGVQSYGSGGQLAELLATFNQQNPNGIGGSPPVMPQGGGGQQRQRGSGPARNPAPRTDPVVSELAKVMLRDYDMMSPIYPDLIRATGGLK